MAQQTTGVAALLLVSVLLAGCGGSGSGGSQRLAAGSSAEGHDKPAWQPSPAAPGEKVFPGLGVRYRPTDETAPVTAADAIKLVRDTPLAHVVTGNPTAVLARATDDDWPPGTPSAHHDENVLAWVVNYRDTMPALHRSSTAPANCDAIVIVDALRATVLDVFQTCAES